jgi:hypothetical protein
MSPIIRRRIGRHAPLVSPTTAVLTTSALGRLGAAAKQVERRAYEWGFHQLWDWLAYTHLSNLDRREAGRRWRKPERPVSHDLAKR